MYQRMESFRRAMKFAQAEFPSTYASKWDRLNTELWGSFLSSVFGHILTSHFFVLQVGINYKVMNREQVSKKKHYLLFFAPNFPHLLGDEGHSIWAPSASLPLYSQTFCFFIQPVSLPSTLSTDPSTFPRSTSLYVSLLPWQAEPPKLFSFDDFFPSPLSLPRQGEAISFSFSTGYFLHYSKSKTNQSSLQLCAISPPDYRGLRVSIHLNSLITHHP